MEAAEGLPVYGADAKTIKYYCSKRNELVPPIPLTSPPLGRQMLSMADSTHAFSCNGQYEPGSFYEIDHDKLPPKSPIQLKALRVVMVSKATMLDVTVSFPSTLALRSYFTADVQMAHCFPELDERFVMSSNQARRILRWRIPSEHLEAGTRMKSFWLVHPVALTAELHPVESDKEEDDTKPVILLSSCLLSLKCADAVQWGIRRKVKYIGGHCASTAEHKVEQSGVGRKRTREITKNSEYNKTKTKRKVDRRETKKPKPDERKCTRGTKERWSTERYEAAGKRLLEIMREKKAELWTPVLRQTLRDEARKHIGDTGLLDHLLKHMAGKIVSDGKDRFRRRHNSEGAMEYWLEPADLVDIRRNAGVNDSFWVPPQGWKLGDSLFPNSCGFDCKLAIADLKHQVAAQYDEQQNLLKQLEKEAREMKEESEKVIGVWQEKCQILLEQIRKQQEELIALFDCALVIKEEVQLFKEKQKPEKKEPSTIEEQRRLNEGGENIGLEAVGGSADANKAGRRSGFRICKPQGTFLWPSMVASSPGMINSSSPRARGVMVPATFVHVTNNVSCASELEQQQQHLMIFPVGGPPSASSSTASTAPKLLFLPTPCMESEQVAVPLLMRLQRAVSSESLCTPPYDSTMPCVRQKNSLMNLF